jgi:iron complex outermembrane receptor protein
VDGVYDGIGGEYDIDRIEVMRGPQGTLYGRSAAGGVVTFHTKDPKLEDFSIDGLWEYGTAGLINTQGAINVPISDKVALRAAFHYLHQDDGYWSGEGVENTTKEGRIKVLFQPSEELSFLLSLSTARTEAYDGGWSQLLPEPNTVIYQGAHGEPNVGPPTRYRQGSLEVNYDLGDSAVTYIGAIKSIDARGQGAVGYNRGSWMTNVVKGEPRETQTHEIRWTSDTDGPLDWLIGASYYHYTYHQDTEMLQVSVEGDEDPTTLNAPIAVQKNKGSNTEYGIFTEETFELRDNMRITAGLRYDKSEVEEYPGFDFNINVKSSTNGASCNPAVWMYMPYYEDKPTFSHVTYKLRFEYDLTPENMLYVLTGTGYLPGHAQISPATIMEEVAGVMVVTDVDIIVLPFDQEKLTSYELGIKNRFLDNTLQLNADIFYLDYEGYQESINITPGAPPPPRFVVVPVPVKMKGLELDMTWLLTQYDKVTFSGGWLDAQIDGYPDIPGSTYNAKDMMYLEQVPGLSDISASLNYDHTFIFGDGSTLVPRAEARYTSGLYLSQLTRDQVEGSLDWRPYMYQDSTVLFNLGATWTSPEGQYSITGYVRNALDEEYKTQVQTPHDPTDDASVTLGDPRTFGVMLRVKF